MNGHHGRRAFLVAAGASLAALSGCTAPVSSSGGESRPAATDDASATESQGAPATDGETTSGSDAIDLPAGASWPTFGGDAANTGRRGEGSGPTGETATAWRTDVDGIYTMPGPAVADGAVYVGSGELAYAADALTGALEWEVDLGALTHYFSPTVTAGGILFPAQSDLTGGTPGTLTSLSTDGDVQWEREFPVTTSPTELDGSVFAGASPTGDAAIRSFDDADGSDRWTHPLDATLVRGAPAVDGGVVYATAADVPNDAGLVVAVDAEDGTERWTREFDAQIQAAPAVRDGTVFVQANDGRLVALDAASGDTDWSARLGQKAKTAPALAEEHLVGMVENRLVGVSLTSGTVEWEADIGYTLINGVSVVGDRAYVGGSLLTAVDVGSGDVAWEKPVPGAAGGFGAPVVVGNTLFVGVCIKHEANDPYDDYLYAYI